MALPNDLLEQSKHLAKRESKRPRQASLRRAVSTVYYALFHHLISEATLNWKRASQRNQFARLFEHGKMKSASIMQRSYVNAYLKTKPGPSPELECAKHLHHIAETFTKAQEWRHLADYDNSKRWSRNEVLTLIDPVEEAFRRWHEIRDEEAAQDFLLSLLGTPKAN